MTGKLVNIKHAEDTVQVIPIEACCQQGETNPHPNTQDSVLMFSAARSLFKQKNASTNNQQGVSTTAATVLVLPW